MALIGSHFRNGNLRNIHLREGKAARKHTQRNVVESGWRGKTMLLIEIEKKKFLCLIRVCV